MNRKCVALIVLLSLFSLHTLTPAQAFWPFGSSDPGNKDLRFETVYPKSSWDSTTWTVLKYVTIVVVIGGVTYFTAGTGTAASAGVIASYIGGTIGSLMYGLAGGAAINAGLALLGGGAVAAGGFGILGGISVINAVGSLALAAAVDAMRSQVPSETHAKSISLIKPRLFWDNVSPVVKDEMKELKNALDEDIDFSDIPRITDFSRFRKAKPHFDAMREHNRRVKEERERQKAMNEFMNVC